MFEDSYTAWRDQEPVRHGLIVRAEVRSPKLRELVSERYETGPSKTLTWPGSIMRATQETHFASTRETLWRLRYDDPVAILIRNLGYSAKTTPADRADIETEIGKPVPFRLNVGGHDRKYGLPGLIGVEDQLDTGRADVPPLRQGGHGMVVSGSGE